MSDANITKLLYAAEGTFGETPDLLSTLKEIRFVSEDLIHAKETVISEEIRSDRSRTELIEVGIGMEGSINTELSLVQYNDFILAALMASAWSNETYGGATTDITGGNTLTLTVGTFSTTIQGAKYVKLSGLTASAEDGIYRIISCSSTVMVIDGTLTNAVGESNSYEVNYARNGITHSSFLIEKQFLSLATPQYVACLGAAVNELNIELEARSRALMSFAYMGTEQRSGTATYGDGSPTAPASNPILNTTSHVGGLRWDSAAFASNVMSLSLTLNNNLRDRPAISRETTLEHGKGTIDLTGTLTAYFEDGSLLADFIAHTDRELLVPLIDSAGDLMSIHLPRIQFPAGNPVIEGINSDVMVPLEFQATLDSAVGYIIQIDQLEA
jgi:hypothetical protein